MSTDESSSREWELRRLNAEMESKLEADSARWNTYFENALHALLEYEMRETDLRAAVAKAGDVADAALEAYRSRWNLA